MGLAKTFPFCPISGPFLPDLPHFCVTSEKVLRSQSGSSSTSTTRVLPSIFIFATALTFSIYYLLLTCQSVLVSAVVFYHCFLPFQVSEKVGSPVVQSLLLRLISIAPIAADI